MTRAADTLILGVMLYLIWQGLHFVVGETALPGPIETVRYLDGMIGTARFGESAEATLLAFTAALALAYGIGLAIGVWMGAHALSREVGEPILVTFATMPKIALYPVILLVFGLSMSGKVVFGALHGILPVSLFTMGAIRNIPPVYLKSARTLHLSRRRTILAVLLPATLPEVVAGLRIGFTTTMLGVLLAEMFASKRGLGFLIMNAVELVRPQEMLSVVLVLFAFAAAANGLMLWIEHRLHRRV